MHILTYLSPLGELTLTATEAGLTTLTIAGQKYAPVLPADAQTGETPVLVAAVHWLDQYFAGAKPGPEALPLAPEGSDFQQLIWQMLCQIPYGHTVTYGALAQKAAEALGRARMSSQAVGSAVGHNPISIIIPCHRVVGADGSLTGYAGGLEKKRWLLQHEGLALSDRDRVLP